MIALLAVLQTATFPPAYWWYADTFVGVGAAATPVVQGPAMTFTAEVGEHPFAGALSTGFFIASASDTAGTWNVITPGIFARVDVTYALLTKLWTQEPIDFPLRVVAGVGVGAAISQSYSEVFVTGATPYQSKTSYVLARVELRPTLDVEIPIDADKHYALLLRGSMDVPVSLTNVFRFSGAVGVSVSWDSVVKGKHP